VSLCGVWCVDMDLLRVLGFCSALRGGDRTTGRGPWDGGDSSQKAEAVSALLLL
jgi:hypothetical protein